MGKNSDVCTVLGYNSHGDMYCGVACVLLLGECEV